MKLYNIHARFILEHAKTRDSASTSIFNSAQ
jgi:hypothetical protein